MSLEILRQFIPSPDELEPDATREVLEHFGPDAPGVLNAYACLLEDLLLEQQQSVLKLRDELHLAQEENKRLRASIQASRSTNPKLSPERSDYSAPKGPDESDILI